MVEGRRIIEERIDSSPQTDSVILRRAQAKDQEAWNTVVELYSRLVNYWCRRSGLSHDVCPKISEEIFSTASADLDRFELTNERQSFRDWLRNIARSKVLDHIRNREKEPIPGSETTARRPASEIPAPQPFNDDPASRAKELEVLSQQSLEMIKNRFSKKGWASFLRTEIEGASPRNVARELGMNVEAIRKAKSRVQGILRDEFGSLLE